MSEDSLAGSARSTAETALYRRAGMLTVIAPPEEAGRSISVDPQGSVVGRDVGCQLAMTNERLSRRHAVVRARGGVYEVQDLGSTNGTLLNGEPVTGVRHLHDGDRIAVADVEIEFRLAATTGSTQRWSRPPANARSQPTNPTEAPDLVIDGPEQPRQSLPQEVQQAPGFSVKALLLAVAGSVVGTVFTLKAGSDQWGALAGAAILPVVSTTFSTKQAGETGRVRIAVIVLLSSAALVITGAGLGLADTVMGKSVITGNPKGSLPGSPVSWGNSNPTPDHTSSSTTPSSTSSTPSVEVQPTPIECGTVAVGSIATCPAIIKYIPGGDLGFVRVTGVELSGDPSGDFTVKIVQDCMLNPGESCPLDVTFQPAATGQRNATLVIHQNLPPPDTGTTVSLTGTGTGTGTDGTTPDSPSTSP